MKLARVELRGLRGVPDVDLDLGGAEPSRIFLVTGPPASGKTRLLEAILAALEVVGPYEGMVRGSSWVRAAGADATVMMRLELDALERDRLETGETRIDVRVRFGAEGVAHDAPRAVERLLAQYAHDDAIGKREYFPETRMISSSARADGMSALEQSLLRPSRSSQKYGFVPRFLDSIRTNQGDRQRFVEALARLAPTLTLDVDDDATWFSSRAATSTPYHALASSEADSVIIAATATMIRLSHSIVLFDRPELYVHRDRIVEWVNGLLALGEDNQWVIATQCKELLGSVAPSQTLSLGQAMPAPTGRGRP